MMRTLIRRTSAALDANSNAGMVKRHAGHDDGQRMKSKAPAAAAHALYLGISRAKIRAAQLERRTCALHIVKRLGANWPQVWCATSLEVSA